MPRPKPEELPEELFSHILRQTYGEFLSSERDEELKQYGAALASVCRYWARLCRPQIFESITLCNLEDVKRFEEILDTPTLDGLAPVASMVERLVAKLDITNRPWLHLVFLQLLPKLRPSKCSFSVVLADGGKAAFHSLHPSLPRSIPGPRMWLCGGLVLRDFHFRSGRTLLSLLSSLPSLTIFSAYSLTFDTRPTARDFLSIPPHQEVARFDTDDIHLWLALIPLFVANITVGESATKKHSRRRPRNVLAEDDAKALSELLSVFHEVSRFSISRAHNSEFWRTYYLKHISSILFLELTRSCPFFSYQDRISW